MNPLIAIPARLAATRLPDKPLADINGTPLILHVWRRAVAGITSSMAEAAMIKGRGISDALPVCPS